MALRQETKDSWREFVPVLALIYIPPIGAILMWLFSRWSIVTKWIVTAVVLLQLAILGVTSYNVYKFVRYQKAYSPIMSVQQALDIYGIQNGKYPAKLDDLKPKYIKEIPNQNELKYSTSNDNKDYSLKVKIEDKELELRPAFAQLPPRD